MKPFDFEIRLDDPPAEAKGARLFLALSRSVLYSVRAEGYEVDARGQLPVVDIAWTGPPGTPPAVKLLIVGEEPELASVEWPDEPRVAAMLREPFVGFPADSERERVRNEYIDNYWKHRTDDIRKQSWRLRPYLRFLADLDRRTGPSTTPTPNPDFYALAGIVGEQLRERVEQRRESLLASGPADPPNLAPVDEQALVLLAVMQRGLYECHLEHPATEARELFTLFARGRLLQSTGSDGVPRSANYLLFAEFSIACITAAVDPGFWASLLYAQVATQEIFHRVFRPKTNPPTWSGDNGYRPKNLRDPAPISATVTDAFVTKLFDHYALLSTGELIEEHAWNVVHSFSDNAPISATQTHNLRRRT